MSRSQTRLPDPPTKLATALRSVDAAAGQVVLAVEALRSALREAQSALDDVLRRPAEVDPPSHARSQTRDQEVKPPALRILRLPDVTRATGLARSTIWRLQGEGRFPKARRLSPRAVGWVAEEIEEWISTRSQLP